MDRQGAETSVLSELGTFLDRSAAAGSIGAGMSRSQQRTLQTRFGAFAATDMAAAAPELSLASLK